MNTIWKDILEMLTQIKLGTHAQFVEFQTAPYGFAVRVDWEDNCHCIRGIGWQEIQSANYQFLPFLVDYFNNEHDKVKEK